MATKITPPEGADEGERDHVEDPASNPSATDAVEIDGADQGTNDTAAHDRAADLAAEEAALLAEITGEGEEETKQPEPLAKEDPAEPAKEEEPKPGEEPKADEPAKAEDATDGEDPKPEDVKLYHRKAQKDINRLLTHRKHLRDEVAQLKPKAEQGEVATTALATLEGIAQDAGFTTAKEITEDLALIGKAFRRKDPEAQASLVKRLADAGFQMPVPQATAPALSDKQREILDQYGLLADFQAAAPAPVVATPPAPVATPPKPEPKPVAQPAGPTPEAVQAIEQGKTQLIKLVTDLRKQHGANAPELLKRIEAGVKAREQKSIRDSGAPIAANRYAAVFEEERDRLLAEAKRVTRPRGPLRPTTKTDTANKSKESAEAAELEAELKSELGIS